MKINSKTLTHDSNLSFKISVLTLYGSIQSPFCIYLSSRFGFGGLNFSFKQPIVALKCSFKLWFSSKFRKESFVKFKTWSLNKFTEKGIL